MKAYCFSRHGVSEFIRSSKIFHEGDVLVELPGTTLEELRSLSSEREDAVFCGTLPPAFIEILSRKGIVFHSIIFPEGIPPHMRGRDLSFAEMTELGARLAPTITFTGDDVGHFLDALRYC